MCVRINKRERLTVDTPAIRRVTSEVDHATGHGQNKAVHFPIGARQYAFRLALALTDYSPKVAKDAIKADLETSLFKFLFEARQCSITTNKGASDKNLCSTRPLC